MEEPDEVVDGGSESAAKFAGKLLEEFGDEIHVIAECSLEIFHGHGWRRESSGFAFVKGNFLFKKALN